MSDELRVMTSFVGERERIGGRLASEVIVDLFAEHAVSVGLLVRATGGFGLRHRLRTDQLLTLSEDPSVVALAVDRPEVIDGLAAAVARVQPRGILTLERAHLLDRAASYAGEGEPIKLSVHLGRHERARGRPAAQEVCAVLRRHGVAGASVLVGVDGTIQGRRERAHLLGRNRGVPTMVVSVGEGATMAGAIDELRGLVPEAPVTLERVTVCKRDGVLLERPRRLPDHDESGRPLWQKLTVVTSESHLHDGEPVHRAIVRRLRASQARGATAVRGFWGFHGDHEPHGDRLLQLGRRVPVLTVVVDTPSHVATSFAVIDELTAEHGLVTAEAVPSVQGFGPGAADGGATLGEWPQH